jgi:hypothetical protein
MRRSERITAASGAVLLVAVVVAATVALALHGSAPAAADLPSQDRTRAPADLFWAAATECQLEAPALSGSHGWTLTQHDDGVVRVELTEPDGVSGDDPDERAFESGMNDCLAATPFEPIDSTSLWSDRSPGERMLLFDVTARVTLPCLQARGLDLDPLYRPYLAWASFVDPQQFPWASLYDLAGTSSSGTRAGFDELLSARLACGVPTDLLGP